MRAAAASNHDQQLCRRSAHLAKLAATRTTLSRPLRNSLLTAHIVLSVSLLGDVLALAAVTLRAIGTDDVDTARVSFETMSMFSLAFGIPLSLGSLVTGVLLGRGTRWACSGTGG